MKRFFRVASITSLIVLCLFTFLMHAFPWEWSTDIRLYFIFTMVSSSIVAYFVSR